MILYRTSFNNFDPTILLGFGIVIILYGIFRMWKGYSKLKTQDDEE